MAPANFKSLADGQLPDSKTTLYTVPASTTAAIKVCKLVNSSASARTVNIYIKRSGSTSRRVIPKDMTFAAGSEAECVDGDPWELSTGDIIEGDASAATEIDYFISGAER